MNVSQPYINKVMVSPLKPDPVVEHITGGRFDMGKFATALANLWPGHRVTLQEKPLAGPEPHYCKPRPMTGLWAQLTPEQKKSARAYRGEENHGDPAFGVKRSA